MVQVGEVVVVEVPEGEEKPYSCGSGYFRRLNGNTQKMNHDEIRIMFITEGIWNHFRQTKRDNRRSIFPATQG
jgi:predicted HTH transcriptional regulator